MAGEKDMIANLQHSKNIHFVPYVGTAYAKSSPRVMLLGEAHHIEAGEASPVDMTTKVVTAACRQSLAGDAHDHWVRYIRNMGAMFSGDGYHGTEHVWDGLAYAVFFQKAFIRGQESERLIGEVEIEQARAAFFDVIGALKPAVVTVWGLSLLNNKWMPLDAPHRVLDPELRLYVFDSYPETFVWHCHHPSRDFSYEREHERWLRIKRFAMEGQGLG